MKKNALLVVLGAGESGIGAALLGVQQGYKVFVSDRNSIPEKTQQLFQAHGIAFEMSNHDLNRMAGARWVVKSPGIPEEVDVVQALAAQGSPIISEIEFASLYTTAKIIAITGSNGKTTTTLMTYQILKDAGLDVGLAGNIGTSFARIVAEQDHEYFVVEVSSFQLDGIKTFAPHVSIITNITPDHLDRYGNSFENYLKAKLRIFENQTAQQHLIYGSDDSVLYESVIALDAPVQKHAFGIDFPQRATTQIQQDQISIQTLNKPNMIATSQFPFQGRHNLLNAMAAATAASLVDIRKETIRESLLHFKGASHRLEQVLNIRKVSYINDSKATNVNATYFALDSMECPTVWIAGGVDKGNDYESLLPLVNTKVKAIICLGVDNAKLVETFEGVVPILIETQSMQEAVKIAHKIAERKEAVLLSPACASFDLFDNYEDRGDQFKAAVRNL